MVLRVQVDRAHVEGVDHLGGGAEDLLVEHVDVGPPDRLERLDDAPVDLLAARDDRFRRVALRRGRIDDRLGRLVAHRTGEEPFGEGGPPLAPALGGLDPARRLRVLRAGHVEAAERHVLGHRHERLARGRREDVVRGEHEDARLGLRLEEERHVHGHLVAVEVGVERLADEGRDLDRLSLDEHRLERLDAEAVERGGAV